MADPPLDPEHPDFDHERAARMAQLSLEVDADFDDLAEAGWDKFEVRPIKPPDGWLTPEDAQQFPVGSLVRFTEDTGLTGGHSFAAGEYARVVEHRLTPVGIVWVTVRGSERRKMMTSTTEPPFMPATNESD